MRVIPEIGQYLTFMDFNGVRTRPRDFAVALLNTVDTHRRTKVLLKLAQNKTKGDVYYEALEESLMMTLSLEIQRGSASKHSRRFNFDEFTTFVATLKDSMAADKDLSCKGLEELIVRLEQSVSKHAKFADNLIFWVAHAKLMRQLKKKMKVLASLLPQDKQSKLDQKTVLQSIVQEYKARKKQFPTVERYLLVTKLPLDIPTFKAKSSAPKVITEN